MTNEINPKFNGISGPNLGNKQQSSKKETSSEEQASSGPAVDPYADQKLDPNQIFGVLSQQGQFSRDSIAFSSISQSMQAFQKNVSPEQHGKLMKQAASIMAEEFGRTPDPELVELTVSNYLIGSPVVSN